MKASDPRAPLVLKAGDRSPSSIRTAGANYVRALRNAGLQGSMGRTGTCADDAGMESFFSLLQKNVLNQKRWACREELRLAIVNWIEATYIAGAANAVSPSGIHHSYVNRPAFPPTAKSSCHPSP